MKRDLESEIAILNKMITSLVEVLEERGIMTNEEWERRIEKKLMEAVEGIDLKETARGKA